VHTLLGRQRCPHGTLWHPTVAKCLSYTQMTSKIFRRNGKMPQQPPATLGPSPTEQSLLLTLASRSTMAIGAPHL
jgi:hypothetical protein